MESPTYVVLSSSSLTEGGLSITLPFDLSFPVTESWSVSLSELSLPGWLFNVKNDFLRIEDEKRVFHISLFDGYYKTVRDLFRSMKWLWREYGVPGRFSCPQYDIQTNRIKFGVPPFQKMTVSMNLARLLTIPCTTSNSGQDKIEFESSNVLTDTEETENICVLLNLVEERMLGNDELPLLTTITIEKSINPRGIANYIPCSMEYLPVKPGIYRNIIVQLKRTDGEMLKCTSKSVLLKLWFIKK